MFRNAVVTRTLYHSKFFDRTFRLILLWSSFFRIASAAPTAARWFRISLLSKTTTEIFAQIVPIPDAASQPQMVDRRHLLVNGPWFFADSIMYCALFSANSNVIKFDLKLSPKYHFRASVDWLNDWYTARLPLNEKCADIWLTGYLGRANSCFNCFIFSWFSKRQL